MKRRPIDKPARFERIDIREGMKAELHGCPPVTKQCVNLKSPTNSQFPIYIITAGTHYVKQRVWGILV